MNSRKTNRRNVQSIAIACALSFAGLAALPGPASAQEPSADARMIQARVALLSVRDLEKAFWICDHTATTRGVDAAPVALCSAVYESLRDQKFAGDFGELLKWWNENKPIQHAALAVGM
jgi:hypothetical protein